MARPDVNRFGEMEVFVRVVERGGLSAAARVSRMTPSAVSKLVSRLEDRLGSRLINRSTRKLQLTPEGAEFYDNAVRILGELDSAERRAGEGATPRGRLRVNTNVAFGIHHLLPLLPDFLDRHPEMAVDVSLTDIVVDLLEERADVAIRVGPMRESRLVARKLGESPAVVVAAPSYLARHGAPNTPKELARHNLLGFCFTRMVASWPFRLADGTTLSVEPSGRTLISDGEAMRHLSIAGAGIARLSRFHIAADIAAGRLVPLLESFRSGEAEPVNAVYVGQGGHLPARVRAFLDYLSANVRLA